MKRLFVIVLTVLAAGCGPRAYERAQKDDTIESYRAYLREHPKEEAAEPARERLAELELEQARKVHTPLAYKRIIEEFPDLPEAQTARTLLEGLRFNAAMQRDDAESLRQFLADHPNGAHANEASARLAQLELEQAKKSDDPKALAEISRRYSDDPRGDEARMRLDDQRFAKAQAEGAFALFKYLADFPAGVHRAGAEAHLLQLRLDGLLFSDELEAARAEASKNPLAAQLAGLEPRFSAEERARALLRSTDSRVQAAFPSNYLRSTEELVRSLQAPDPFDRWQAAEELSSVVSVIAIDPLIGAIRTGRNALIRREAYASLRAVLHALPPSVAHYELASRLESLRATAASPEVSMIVAVLLDLSGSSDAMVEFQKSYSAENPDPVVLFRFIELRAERKQWFSQAVAARTLALWAEKNLNEATTSGEGIPLTVARQICASAVAAKVAVDVLGKARGEKTDFPEDLLAFELKAKEVSRLAEARLSDAELQLHTQDKRAPGCREDPVRERLNAAVSSRVAALKKLPPSSAEGVKALVRERDPSDAVRAAAK